MVDRHKKKRAMLPLDPEQHDLFNRLKDLLEARHGIKPLQKKQAMIKIMEMAHQQLEPSKTAAFALGSDNPLTRIWTSNQFQSWLIGQNSAF
jgi:hypothetical protein